MKLTRQELIRFGGGAQLGSATSYGLAVRVDHVSYAVSHSELSDTVQRLGAALGAAFQDGGRHPQFGTCNFVLPLAGGMYIEVVAPLDHPAADRAPFGNAVRRIAENGGGWLGWVVSVSDLPGVEQRLGRSAVSAHRRRPDGFELNWKQIGINDLLANPQLPFFIHWECPTDQHPSAGGGSIEIAEIEICGDETAVTDFLGAPKHNPLEDVKVTFVSGPELGLQSVTFKTPTGLVKID